MVTDLTEASGVFLATMDDGLTITAEKVLAVPGIRERVLAASIELPVRADRPHVPNEQLTLSGS